MIVAKPKILVIYESIHHGNTEKVAKKISNELDADLIKASEVQQLGEYDVIGLGSGTYLGRHHRNILKLINDDFKGREVFIFSTGAYPMFRHFYHLELRYKLKHAGADVLGEFGCKGFTTYGPYGLLGGSNKGRPTESDMRHLKSFCRDLRSFLNSSRGFSHT
jgi:flavodoxin